MSEWISVLDRYPAMDKKRLYLVAVHGCEHDYLISNFNTSLQAFDCEELYYVTHWMPLPAPPTQD